MRAEQLIPSQENVEIHRRVPGSLTDTLRGLWLQHFGDRGMFAAKEGGLFGVDYAQYQYKSPQVALALEHLHKLGFIDPNPMLFTPTSRMIPDLEPEVLDELLFRRKLLTGIDAMVIGGPEGRIFAEMGASVVDIDPFIDRAPKLNLPNLEEVADIFGPWNVPTYKGRFHLTFSTRLFDLGSGLVSHHDHWEGRDREVYQETLGALLEVTRVGGISIHDGDAVPVAFEGNLDRCRFVETASISEKDPPGSTFQMYVLQRT